MSDLSDKIAEDHHTFKYRYPADDVCICGAAVCTVHGFARHVAEITETALRAQIAADINAQAVAVEEWLGSEHGSIDGLVEAAKIAREGSAS